ncbi:hypothetical protein PENTCL1PPCAC_28736, partial [Pristionchus entomophagus]
MVFLRTCLFLAFLSSLAASWGDNDCLMERQREREQDQREFDCRTCKVLPRDDTDNCPKTGYDCDEKLPMTATILTSDDPCACAQMKCAASNATMAVNGDLVGKV